MTEHPILISTENVRAILDGRKTQTRRIIKPQPFRDEGEKKWVYRYPSRNKECLHFHNATEALKDLCPYGKVGDMLWVRESFQIHANSYSLGMACGNYADGKRFKVVLNDRENRLLNNRKYPNRKTSGRFMYKSLARIFLEITNIRVERVQDMSCEDIDKEGIKTVPIGQHYKQIAKEAFKNLWNSLNAKRGYGWDKNSWVWVIEWKQLML